MDTSLDSRRVTFDPSSYQRDTRCNHKFIKSNIIDKDRDSEEGKCILKIQNILLFSLSMLIVPLVSYLIVHEYLKGTQTVSVLASVFSIQITIFAFIFKAFRNEKQKFDILTTPMQSYYTNNNNKDNKGS